MTGDQSLLDIVCCRFGNRDTEIYLIDLLESYYRLSITEEKDTVPTRIISNKVSLGCSNKGRNNMSILLTLSPTITVSSVFRRVFHRPRV